MKQIFLTTIGLIFCLSTYSQNNQKPAWCSGVKPNSDFYDYYVGTGDDFNEPKAKEQAVSDVKSQISDEVKAEYKVKSVTINRSRETQKGKNFVAENDFEIVATVEQTGQVITVTGIREVETYRENSKYYVLYRVPKKGRGDAPEILFKSDKSSIWRSAIYSGWGQMYENKKGKGYAFLSLQTLSIAGIVTGQLKYASNIDDANSASNQNRQIYIDNANTWESIRNVSGIVLGAIYILNIIDITTSSKPKIYSTIKRLELQPVYYANS